MEGGEIIEMRGIRLLEKFRHCGGIEQIQLTPSDPDDRVAPRLQIFRQQTAILSAVSDDDTPVHLPTISILGRGKIILPP